jgi:hypothetical protein
VAWTASNEAALRDARERLAASTTDASRFTWRRQVEKLERGKNVVEGRRAWQNAHG